MALRHWLTLAMTDGIGPILLRRLIDRCGTAEATCAADSATIASVDGIGRARSAAIYASLKSASAKADAELARAAALNVTVISQEDEQYPPLLRSIPDPPAVLYMRGDLQPRDLNALAIVGSRKCSHYGREQAERFGALLAGTGLTVVSGGARRYR